MGGIGEDGGCPSCSERTRNTAYICKFVQCVCVGGGGGVGIGGGDRGCPSCSERTRNTTYICKFVQCGGRGWGGGQRLSKLLKRGQDIQPISVSLFSVCGGDRGGQRLSKLLREDKKYSLYL